MYVCMYICMSVCIDDGMYGMNVGTTGKSLSFVSDTKRREAG